QTKVNLMNEGCWLQGLARLLGRQPDSGELAPLVIDEGEEFGRGLGIAGCSRSEEVGDVDHTEQLDAAVDWRSIKSGLPSWRSLQASLIRPLSVTIRAGVLQLLYSVSRGRADKKSQGLTTNSVNSSVVFGLRMVRTRLPLMPSTTRVSLNRTASLRHRCTLCHSSESRLTWK